MAQDQTQQVHESTLSTLLWIGGALLAVVIVAVYAAM